MIDVPTEPTTQKLNCSLCGELTVLVDFKERSLTVRSPLRVFTLHTEIVGETPRIERCLTHHQLGEVHQALRDAQADGLDYYCPSCNAVYCAAHYPTLPDFDEGFYDCSRAVCPKGHRRVMDD